MDKRKYNQIRDCMRQLIKGTPFENKVFFGAAAATLRSRTSTWP